MEFGILMGDQPVSTPPAEHFDLLLRKVEAAQKAGFTYLTIGQHFLYDGFRWFQPVPMLARLAAELDDHVRIGTTVLVGPVHHPVALAEELATLDVITRGKLVVGIGTGYLPDEYEVFGKPFKQRYSLLEELIEVMTKVWTQDRVTHHGKFFDIEDRPTHLHPVQKPRPPIWLGAMKEMGVRRAARHGDVWTITPQQTIDQVEDLIGAYIDERATARPAAARSSPSGASSRSEPPMTTPCATSPRWPGSSTSPTPTRACSCSTASGSSATSSRTSRTTCSSAPASRCATRSATSPRRLPVGPLLIRPHWPGMDAAQTEAYLERVGREVVEPLKDLESIGFDQF